MTQKEKDNYKSPRTQTWKDNHRMIFDEYWKLYEETGKRPLQSDIADNLKIARKTVNSHLKEMDLFDGMDNHKKFRDEVINQLRSNGDASSLKLWLQVVFGWSEKKTVETVKKDDTIKIDYVKKDKPNIVNIKEAQG